MAMMKQTPAANPDAYVSALRGWRRELVETLRDAVRSAAKLDEVIKWGHLVYFSNGPVLLIRAEESRVLFGFWRGQRLTAIEPRLKGGGMYEMATLDLREGATIAPAVARRLVKEAVALNAKVGDPTHDAKPASARKPAAASKPRTAAPRTPARKPAPAKSGGKSVSAYLAALSPDARKAVRKLITIIRATAPRATETISYGIPAFCLDERVLIYCAGWKSHTSLYPMTDSIRSAFKSEIAGYRTAKGTIQFPLSEPLPVALVKKLVKARVTELRAKSKPSAIRRG